MSVILFSGTIGPIPVNVIMREVHETKLGLTDQPIETGAKITDHAYVEPKRVIFEFADENAAGTYNALVTFQESRVPFTAVSGLFVYNNMLIESLSAERDENISRILKGKAELREVIIVSTAYTASEGESNSAQSKGKAGGKNSTQSAKPTKGSTSGAVTNDRASATSMRGDVNSKSISTPAAKQSLLSRLVK